MKLFFIIIGVSSLLYLFTNSTYAQTVTPTLQDTQIATQSANLPASVDSNTNANNTITGVESFIGNLEKLSGGFVFSTPDLFANTITLADGTALKGFSEIRNILLPISIPITALLIFWIGASNMTQGKVNFIKPFLGRLVFYGFLALMLTTLLSFSIQFENTLTSVILSIPSQKVTNLSSFSTDFYNKAQNQISSGQSTPESLGIYNSSITSFFQSIGYRITMMLLGLVTILALIFGFIFILAQFALRFLGLLFLSLIFPLVIPFVLTEKTEGIFYTYLRIWFTFLIHQPAFALGYVIIMMIARSILLSNGASLGLLFLYIASLFFLGTINVLAAKIFADAWIAVGANVEAAAVAGGVLSGAGLTLAHATNIAKGVKSMGSKVGGNLDQFTYPSKRTPSAAWAIDSPRGSTEYGTNIMLQNSSSAMSAHGTPSPILPHENSTTQSDSATPKVLPSYAQEFNKNGFAVNQMDPKNGIYSVSGKGYSYYDSKNNLTHTFPSKRDAIDSGYKEENMKFTTISKRKVIDLSHFPKGNPYNATATKRAQELGFASNYAHVTSRSDAIRIKHNLEMNQEKFKELGVQGYLSKHYDNPNGAKSSKRATTRIITVGKPEE